MNPFTQETFRHLFLMFSAFEGAFLVHLLETFGAPFALAGHADCMFV